MNTVKSPGTLMGTSVLSALAASLCCITPVVSLLAGSSSLAANLSWFEPARPYLIGLSITVLALAWYVQLKPSKSTNMDNCNCEVSRKPTFFQSKAFLMVVTVFTVLMMAFPLYAQVFYSTPAKQGVVAISPNQKAQTAIFTLKGMTCAGCEGHVNSEAAKVKGVLDVKTSYAAGTSTVKFNPQQVSIEQIRAAILKTGYTIVSVKNQ